MAGCSGIKKTLSKILSVFSVVEQGYKLSNKFIEDLQKIHDYIEHFHVNLTR